MSALNFTDNNFHDIYLRLIESHVHDYDYENTPRNASQYEKLFTSFTLTNPVERVCYASKRRENIFFDYAEVLWYLSGSDSLDFIRYYAPGMAQFSSDNQVLTGTATGPRIFHWNTCIDQWDQVKQEIKRSPDSKRAAIQIFRPEELLDQSNIDVASTLSMQFLLRNGRLHLITTMRANDMYRGIVSDVFAFTFLQELMAAELGVEIGSYHHQVGSSHLYMSDFLRAMGLLENPRKFTQYRLAFDRMPKGSSRADIDKLLFFENELRNNVPFSRIRSSNAFVNNGYWSDILLLLEIYRQWKFERRADAELISQLSVTHQYLVRNYLTAKGAVFPITQESVNF